MGGLPEKSRSNVSLPAPIEAFDLIRFVRLERTNAECLTHGFEGSDAEAQRERGHVALLMADGYWLMAFQDFKERARRLTRTSS